MSNSDFFTTSDQQPQMDAELLPGFGPSLAVNAPEPKPAPAEQDVAPTATAPFTSPSETEHEVPASTIHIRPDKNSLELHPPAKERAAREKRSAQNRRTAMASPRFNTTTVLAALSAVLGLGLLIACISLLRSPEHPADQNQADIPLALLPETADAALWPTVAGMSGAINGVPLQFERGLACGNEITYKLQLDFCRSGSDIYAKVAGDRLYVVRLDAQGKILKAYPASKNSKPLKDLFAK